MKNTNFIIDDRPNDHPEVVAKLQKMWDAFSVEEKAEIDILWKNAKKKLQAKKKSGAKLNNND